MVWVAAMVMVGYQVKHPLRVPKRLPEWEVACVPNTYVNYVDGVLKKEKVESIWTTGSVVEFLVTCSEEEAHKLRRLIISDANLHGYLKYLSRWPLRRTG